MPCTNTGSRSGSKNGSDSARAASRPCASRVRVSSRPLSQMDETRFGPQGITSTQPAVSISPSTVPCAGSSTPKDAAGVTRSEEHTSELQSRLHLLCRLLLEKKKQGAQE